MAVKTISISLVGDRNYVNALSALAHKRNKRIGDLVREALDAQYGDELKELVSFFENGDASVHQMMLNKSRPRTTKGGKK